MKREFVTTCYIIKDEKVLLHFHEKLQRWLPPGGHVEENETPVQAMFREVDEECGLDVELIQDEHFWIESEACDSFARPHLCLLENIPAYKEVPAHQHMDFVYVGMPKVGSEVREGCGFKWFSLEDLEGLDLFPDVREVVTGLLSEVVV